MAIEIERKFRIASDAWRDEAKGAPRVYRQGYLAFGERAILRVRLSDDGQARLCVKERKVGISRREYEYPIPVEDARELLDLAAGGVIGKRRHLVEHGGRVWEVDEFLHANAGLVVAEIELANEGEAFSRPSWIGAEVTGDERYYNAALALHPWPEWKEDA